MKIVAISGSLRAKSSNTALLRAAARVAPPEMSVIFYEGLGALPHFNPDLDVEGSMPPPAVREVRELLDGADGILICSPEYAYGVPGSLKNLLDWLVSCGELVGKPVLLINAASGGGATAQASLVQTLTAMHWNVLAEASLRGNTVDGEIEKGLRGALDALEAAIRR